ncbi:hypothetical protein D3C83_148240 [compost metagenome]
MFRLPDGDRDLLLKFEQFLILLPGLAGLARLLLLGGLGLLPEDFIKGTNFRKEQVAGGAPR